MAGREERERKNCPFHVQLSFEQGALYLPGPHESAVKPQDIGAAHVL
jgi:hypothetical protein